MESRRGIFSERDSIRRWIIRKVTLDMWSNETVRNCVAAIQFEEEASG